MSNRFLISVAAAALIAGTGFANAQGAGGANKEYGTGGATTQHNAPSGGASSGTMEHDKSGMKGSEHSTTGQSPGAKGMESEKGQPGASGKNAQDTAPGQKSKDMKAEERGKSGTVGESREKSSGTESRDKSGAMEKKGMDTQKGMETQKGATEQKGMETQKGATDTSRPQTTTGNAATSATAAPPAEKRSQITTAIKSEHVTETTNVNFNVAVGTRVPADVRFYPVPERVVTIYPQWRGYEFILVKGRYVIVQPETHEIVYILEG